MLVEQRRYSQMVQCMGKNAYEQTRYVLEKQVKLIEQAGAGVGDVIKVDVFAVDMKMCADISRGIFRDIS